MFSNFQNGFVIKSIKINKNCSIFDLANGCENPKEDSNDFFKIIGNKYENSELLEK